MPKNYIIAIFIILFRANPLNRFCPFDFYGICKLEDLASGYVHDKKTHSLICYPKHQR